MWLFGSATLLKRLKNLDDQTSWNEFCRTYQTLIFRVARRSGLDEHESEEVVQSTLISVAKKMPSFTYNPAKDSFKGWLLTVTRWRIRDQLQKRSSMRTQEAKACPHTGEEPGTRTNPLEQVPDPAGRGLEAIWDEEWTRHVLQTALAHIKRQVNPQHYEIYHLHVVLGQSVREVTQALDVNAGQVYLAKHRVGSLLAREIRKLDRAVL